MPGEGGTRGRIWSRGYDQWSRYLALFAAGIVLVSSGIVLAIPGNDHGTLKDLLVACLALVGLAISLELEIVFRIAERGRTYEKYERLLQTLEDYPELNSALTKLSDASVATLKRNGCSQFQRAMWRALNHADAQLQELAQGRLHTPRDFSIVQEQFKDAKRIQATTDDYDAVWWTKDTGKAFSRLNCELAGQGCVIERVWILSKGPGDDASGRAIKAELEKQRQANVHVFVVDVRADDMESSLVMNMTMMDGVFLHEDLANKRGIAVEYLLSENASDLDRARVRFLELKTRAERYEGPDTLNLVFPDAAPPGPDDGRAAPTGPADHADARRAPQP